jgi:hypothetical protein
MPGLNDGGSLAGDLVFFFLDPFPFGFRVLFRLFGYFVGHRETPRIAASPLNGGRTRQDNRWQR